MKILLMFAIVGFLVVGAADAKEYKCTNHYSYDYCVKTGQITPVKETTVQKTTPITNATTIDLTQPKRDVMDSIEADINALQKEIATLKTDIEVIDRNIQTLDHQVKLANDKENQAKLNHKIRPNDTTRIESEKAAADLEKAKDLLKTEQGKRKTLFEKLDAANKRLGELQPKLKEVAYSKRNGKSGVQTIGINLSNTCIAMIKNNITSNCPSYESLMLLNWDTSKRQSGEFAFENGYYHRQKPQVKNDHKLYSLYDYNIIIDPSPAMMQHIKTITISSNLESYLLSSDMAKKDDGVRYIHKDRYVDSCQRAIISAPTWQTTLSDTIQYLRGGCTTTLLGTVDAITDEKTVQDISTSSKYKHDQWIKQIKESHKQLLINKDNSTNKSVTEDEG